MKWIIYSVAVATANIFSLPGTANAAGIGGIAHEKRDLSESRQWIKRDRVEGSTPMPIRIGLAQRNLDRGYKLLMDVSDPTSPNFGKHWTSDEVVSMFSPSDDAFAAVQSWLVGFGIDSNGIERTESKGWLMFNATVDVAERLLNAKYYHYDHEAEGYEAIGCDEYELPSHLSEHIDFVYPAVKMVSVSKRDVSERKSKRSSKTRVQHEKRHQPKDGFNNTSCFNLATPECIQRLYNVPPADKAHKNNSLGIFEFGAWYDTFSLNVFFANFSPSIPQDTKPINLSIDLSAWHYDDDYDSAFEADLDIQVAYPLVYPQTVTVFQSSDDFYSGYGKDTWKGWFQDWLDAVDGSYCNYTAFGETGNSPTYDHSYPDNHTIVPEIPLGPGNYNGTTACGTLKSTNVVSFSYGDVEGSLPTNYIYRQCNEFMKLGLQGITVVFASGDSGVAPTSGCYTGLDYYHRTSQYPSNCPYVLSVGATQLTPSFTEEPANTPNFWATSGGFSYNYSRPAYQDHAISSYLAHYKPSYLPDDSYNAQGRGFPDISALGQNIAGVGRHGTALEIGAGTSAAAPIVASLLNRINEERLAVGKRTVGFVNPVLYAHPEIFNDIVVGNNSLCGEDGFQAVPGWDPVTGLGTLDYEKALRLFLALP